MENNLNIEQLINTIVLYMNIVFDVLRTKFRDTFYLFKKEGIYYSAINTSPKLTNNKLKLVSYNIDDIAVHRCYHKSHDEARAQQIFSLVNDLNPDVICLQEVWGETIKRELFNAFINNNYYVALPNYDKRFFIGENSGLMTASRFPITAQTFLPFKHGYDISSCSLTNKGVQYCHLNIPTNEQEMVDINIANTHLKSSFTHVHSILDFSSGAKRQLETIVNQCPYEHCILVGDMNLTPAQLGTLIESVTNEKLQLFGENTDATFVTTDTRLDHVLQINNTVCPTKVGNLPAIQKPFLSATNSVNSDYGYSDHLPVITEIELNVMKNDDSPRRASP